MNKPSSPTEVKLMYTSFFQLCAGALLAPKGFSNAVQALFLWISNLHCIIILLFAQLNLIVSIDKTEMLSYELYQITKTLTMQQVLDFSMNSFGLNSLVIAVWVYVFCLLIILSAVIIIFRFNQNLTKAQSIFIYSLSQFHLNFGFWITSLALFSANLYLQRESEISTGDVFIRSIHILLIIINYIITLVMSIYSYPPYRDCNRYSAHTSIFQVLSFILKGCLIPFIAFQDRTNLAVGFFVAFSSLILIIRHYTLISNFPYYYISAMRISITLSAVSLLIAGFSIIALILRGLIDDSGAVVVYGEVVLLPLIIKQSEIYIQTVIQAYHRKNIEQINTDPQAIRKLFSLTYILQNSGNLKMDSCKNINLAELQLWGGITHCLDKKEALQCSAQNSASDFVGSQAVERFYTDLMKMMIQKTLTDLQKRMPESKKLKFILATHIFETNENCAAAINYLAGISRKKGPLQAPAIRLLKEIEQKIQSRYQNVEKGSLDIKSFIDFDIIAMDFTRVLYANTEKFINFWKTYKKAKFEIMDLFNKSKVIELNDDKINKLWSRKIENQPLFANSLKNLYSIYLLFVRNAPATACKIKNKFKAYDFYADLIDREDAPALTKNLISPDHIIITASMSKGQLGRVTYASSNITNSLGWTQYDLVGRNINVLMMPFMREKHGQVMAKHLEASNPSAQFSKTTGTYILTKGHYIMKCNISLSIHPYVMDELRYTAIIKLQKNHNQHLLILDENGNIEGFTKGIAEEFKLDLGRQIGMADICTGIQELNSEEPMYESRKSILYQAGKLKNSMPNNKEYIKSSFSIESKNTTHKLKQTEFYLNLERLDKKCSTSFLAKRNRERFGDLVYQTLSLTNHVEEIEKSFSLQEGVSKRVEEKLASTVDDVISIPNEKAVNIYIRTVTDSKRKSTLAPHEIEKAGLLQNYASLGHGLDDKAHRPLKTSINSINKKSEKSSPGKFIAHMEKKTARRRAAMEAKGDHLDGAGSSYYSSTSNINAKVEEAIYTIPKQSGLRNLNWLMLVIIVMTASFMICFGRENATTLKTVEALVDVVSASTMQLLVLVEFKRLTSWYAVLDMGIGTYDRFTWAGIPDTRFILSTRLAIEQPILLNYSTLIRSSINMLDKASYPRIYAKIPAIEWDPITKKNSMRETNSLDLVTDIITAGQKIINTPYEQLNSSDRDVAFISNNTMDSLLVAGEDLALVILGDTKQKLSSLSSLLVIFLSVVAALSAVFIGLLFNLQKKLINDKDRLFDIILRLSDYEIDKRLIIVTKFQAALDKNSLNGRYLEFETHEDESPMFDIKAKQQSSLFYKKRLASRKNIHVNLIKIAVGSLFIVILFLVGFLAVFVTLEKQNSAISKKIDTITTSNMNLYQLGVIFVGLLDYVAKNTTSTIRGLPSQAEYTETFAELSNLQSKLIAATDDKDGIGGDAQLVELIKGNLCQALTSDPYAGAQCASLIYGIVQKGMIDVNTFMIAFVQNTKNNFDASNRTHQDMYKAITQQDFIQVDPVWALYMLPGYQEIDKLIRERLALDFNTYQNAVSTVISVCGVLFIMIGLVLWWRVKDLFDQERIGWRKIVRLIPDTVVLNNKMLKNYLVANTTIALANLESSK